MTKIKVLSAKDGSCVEEITLEHDLAGIEYNMDTIYKALAAVYGNMNRVRSSHYKNVSGITGSTRKMRPQKRTGKSRQGSIREIHMRGGAVKFGFTGDKAKDLGRRFRSFKFINKKESKVSRLQVFANRFQFNKLFIVDSLASHEKTKDASNMLKILGVKKPLIVFGQAGISCGFNNVKDVAISNVEGLNIYKMIRSVEMIFDKTSVEKFIQNVKITK